MLTCQRHLFSLPEDMHYINCAYMSPLLKSVQEAGVEGVKRKAVPTSIHPEHFFSESEALREQFAHLVNASPDQVALVPAVSYGVAIASHNLRLGRGQNVVFPGEEFPSNVYAWIERCQKDGAELRIVDRPRDVQHPGTEWNNRILEAIDRNTAVVTLTAVHWTDGTLFDLEAIARRAREVKAMLIIDGTQSVGALPFDFQHIQPDLLVCAGYKWLLGPYQTGFAVVGERLLDAEPFEFGWINREGSEDFSRLVSYRDGYQPGARRFDVGERSNPISVPMLLESLRQIQTWGVEQIQAYCGGLAGVLEQALSGGDFLLSPKGERTSHLFGVRVPDESRLPAIVTALRTHNVHVSLRGSSVRVSPHVYNTPEDMLALAEALQAATR